MGPCRLHDGRGTSVTQPIAEAHTDNHSKYWCCPVEPVCGPYAGSPEEWRNIEQPVLGICAIATVSSEFPWLSPGDSLFSAARSYVELIRAPFQHAECARFQRAVPHSRIIELSGHHYVFAAHREAVIAAMRQFLLQPSSGFH
ncbi:MAG: Pimeloyl-ACP methyl ester carboxylesterase [Gemmatimonadetes bacterium]|nr:Pimeloyl-ACP methyl ester carboxylesterase [Gemmatimonadota bacterium]